MKPMSEIVEMQEYKNHVFQAALAKFANSPSEGPSLYFDTFTNDAIIYHLKSSRHIKPNRDEVSFRRIPEFIEELENVDERTREDLTEISDKFKTVATNAGFEFDLDFKPLVAYDAKGWDEIWENNEFSDRFKADVANLVKLLTPIQRIVSDL